MNLFTTLSLVFLLTTTIACSGATQFVTETSTPIATATTVPTPTPLPTSTPLPTPSPSPTPEALVESNPLADGVDAQTILSAALEAMEGLDSVHFELEAELGMESADLTATFPFRFIGDYQAPDRMRGEMALSLGFAALEMQMINIGTDAYITDPSTGLWERTDGNALGTVNPTEFTGLSEGAQSMELSLAGQETLADGTPVLHLTGHSTEPSDVDGPELDLNTDIYIGLGDSLIYKVIVEGDIPLDPDAVAETIPGLPIPLGDTEGTATISMTTTFSAFNVPVEIEAPVVE